MDRQSNQDLAEVDVSDLVEEILHKKQATETVKTLLHQKGYFGCVACPWWECECVLKCFLIKH